MFARVQRSGALRNTRSVACRGMALKASLPPLPYAYEALEPAISGEIMEIHHAKHHATYVNNFNATLTAIEAAQEAGDVPQLITLQSALKFNGGGHVNHSLFWENLAPVGQGGSPSGDLASAIDADFGSLDAFKTAFGAAAVGVQGSGWAWLVYNKSTGRTEITTRANQDPVSTNAAHVPLLGVDVWEHAYYLQYKNVRPDYIKAVWDVVNWKVVEERLAAAKK